MCNCGKGCPIGCGCACPSYLCPGPCETDPGCCVEGANRCTRAVETRSTVTVEAFREYAGIGDNVTDGKIARWIKAAKQEADRYLANDFCGGPIPEAVELGILAYAEILSASMSGSGGLGAASIASQSVGSVSISYNKRAADAEDSPTNDALAAAIPYWSRYRALIFRRLC